MGWGGHTGPLQWITKTPLSALTLIFIIKCVIVWSERSRRKSSGSVRPFPVLSGWAPLVPVPPPLHLSFSLTCLHYLTVYHILCHYMINQIQMCVCVCVFPEQTHPLPHTHTCTHLPGVLFSCWLTSYCACTLLPAVSDVCVIG